MAELDLGRGLILTPFRLHADVGDGVACPVHVLGVEVSQVALGGSKVPGELVERLPLGVGFRQGDDGIPPSASPNGFVGAEQIGPGDLQVQHRLNRRFVLRVEDSPGLVAVGRLKAGALLREPVDAIERGPSAASNDQAITWFHGW